MNWLKRIIIRWLGVPTHVDYYFVSNCVFTRETPEEAFTIKTFGEIVKKNV